MDFFGFGLGVLTMFYGLEDMMWSGLKQIERELPSLLRDRNSWTAIEEVSIVTIQAVTIPVSFHNCEGHLVLSTFVDAGVGTYRRYRTPFVLEVIEGTYCEQHEERKGEKPPRFLMQKRTYLTEGAKYGCFSPHVWQSIELGSDTVSNIVLTGPRYSIPIRKRGYGEWPRVLCKGSRDRLLNSFKLKLARHYRW